MTEKRNPRLRVDLIMAAVLAVAASCLLVPLAPAAWHVAAYGPYEPYCLTSKPVDRLRCAMAIGVDSSRCEWARQKRFSWLPGPEWADCHQINLVDGLRAGQHVQGFFASGNFVLLREAEPWIGEEDFPAILASVSPHEAICRACAKSEHDSCAREFTIKENSTYENWIVRSNGWVLYPAPGEYHCACPRTGPCARMGSKPQ